MKYNRISIFTFFLLTTLATIGCKSKSTIKPQKITQDPTAKTKYSQDTELQIPISDSLFISGSLTYASSNNLSIIIAGSGPTDRNCNSHMGLKTNAFMMLADSLKQHGISCFRYDKRGIGKSSRVGETDISFDDFVMDASKIVEFFKEDFSQINLIGHSEGALIGSIVCNSNDDVYSFISLTGTSTPIDSIVLDQIAKFPKLVDESKKHFEEIKAGDTLSQVNPMLKSLFRPSIVNFLSSLLVYHPAEEFSKLSIPVLVIGGTCDQQVPEQHAGKLFNSLKSHKTSDLKIITGMGHLLKKNRTDCSDNSDAYSNPNKLIHPELLSAITDFINSSSKLKTQDP